nr:VENN motif pre-toxin domain-containing protein [Gilliamella apicola]
MSALSQLAAGLATASVGGDVGDVGASIAASKNAVENNRLTTRRENKRIRKLAKGDKQEELRYLAAACALIKCSSELADNDPQKAALRELEKLGSSDELQAYREMLEAQEHTKNRTIFGIPYQKNEKLFQYTFFDGIFDGTKNIDNEYSITTRAGGVLQIGFAAIDGFGAAALLPGCSSVVGCIPSAYLTWSMADNGVTGLRVIYNGKSYHTQTAEGLSKILGMSASDAELLFSLSTGGVTAKGFSDLAWKSRAIGKLSAKDVEQLSKNVNKATAGGAGKGANGQIIKNSEGLNEVKINQTPLEGQNRLNTPDLGGSGKLKPAEAAAAAQLEPVLGKMERYTPPPGAVTDKTPDFVITSGPNKGKTVDAMYTTDKLSQKEIDGLNKFYEKNMNSGAGQKVIQEHLKKADYVPVDFRVLTPANQKVFIDYIKTLPKSQQDKIIIMR